MPLDHPTQATDLAARLRATRGIAHKSDLAPILSRLNVPAGTSVGDDCAAIPDGDGYLLVAIEGFLNDFVASDPWFAGWCGVMVNASDVAAMGGRALAVVDALWSAGQEAAVPILEGLLAAADAYGIPVVGGHTNTRNDRPQLSVAIVGRAKRLITSFDARPGEQLLAAIDLRGRMRSPALWWDASSHHTDTSHLRPDLAILPELAEAGLTGAGKDISMGGLIGTALMLAEASRVGLTIGPALVPRPGHIDPADWLSCFPSYGYLLTATDRNAADVIARFAARAIACAAIGVVDDTGVVRLQDPDGAHATVWDFTRKPLIGCVSSQAT